MERMKRNENDEKNGCADDRSGRCRCFAPEREAEKVDVPDNRNIVGAAHTEETHQMGVSNMSDQNLE